MRRFALKGLSDVSPTSKGENKAFPSPSPSCNVVLLFELPLQNKQTKTTLNGGKEEGCGLFCSLK